MVKSALQADTAITRSSRAIPRRRLSSSTGLFHEPAREWLALASTRCAREVTSRSNHSRAVVSTIPDAAHVSRDKPTIKASITCAILGIFLQVYVQYDYNVDEGRTARRIRRFTSAPCDTREMEIRRAEPDDALAVAQVHIRSWQHAYRTLLPEDYLNQLRPEDRAKRYNFANCDPRQPRTLVAVDNGSVVGFATTSASRDADLPQHGELCALYVDPDHWRRGVGAGLIEAARTRLCEAGHRKAYLWLMAGNVRADHFYQSDGWSCDGLCEPYTVGAVTVKKLRYQRELAG